MPFSTAYSMLADMLFRIQITPEQAASFWAGWDSNKQTKEVT